MFPVFWWNQYFKFEHVCYTIFQTEKYGTVKPLSPVFLRQQTYYKNIEMRILFPLYLANYNLFYIIQKLENVLTHLPSLSHYML